MYYELLSQGVMEKSAAGKMMCVSFWELEQDGEAHVRHTRGIVYMPDCKKFRDILNGDDKLAKAELIQKFTMPRLSSKVHYCSVGKVRIDAQ